MSMAGSACLAVNDQALQQPLSIQAWLNCQGLHNAATTDPTSCVGAADTPNKVAESRPWSMHCTGVVTTGCADAGQNFASRVSGPEVSLLHDSTGLHPASLACVLGAVLALSLQGTINQQLLPPSHMVGEATDLAGRIHCRKQSSSAQQVLGQHLNHVFTSNGG